MIRILLPSRGRVEKLEALIPKLVASLVDDVKLYVIQYDEDEKVKYEHHPQLHVMQSAVVGFWACLNDWMVYSGHDDDPFIWLADDIKPARTWLEEGIRHWEARFPDGLGLLVFNDLLARYATAAFAMTTPRWLYVLFGCPRFPSALPHNFMDTVVADRSKDLNRYYFCEQAIVEHLHFLAGKAEKDETYKANIARSTESKKVKDRMDVEWRSGGLRKAKQRMESII